MNCIICGSPLMGKQKKYCSRECETANYRAKNAEKIKVWYLKNREKHKATTAKYQKDHPEQHREYQRRYMAKQKELKQLDGCV